MRGLIAVSDSVCTFNPMYGQGMTVAALCARALESTLERVSASDEAFERSFFATQWRAALKDAWSLATSVDMRFPGTQSDMPSPSAFAAFFGDAIQHSMLDDQEILRRATTVYYMLKPLRALFEPDLAARILIRGGRHMLEKRLRPRPLPEMPPG
jgi:hypothetical protein